MEHASPIKVKQGTLVEKDYDGDSDYLYRWEVMYHKGTQTSHSILSKFFGMKSFHDLEALFAHFPAHRDYELLRKYRGTSLYYYLHDLWLGPPKKTGGRRTFTDGRHIFMLRGKDREFVVFLPNKTEGKGTVIKPESWMFVTNEDDLAESQTLKHLLKNYTDYPIALNTEDDPLKFILFEQERKLKESGSVLTWHLGNTYALTSGYGFIVKADDLDSSSDLFPEVEAEKDSLFQADVKGVGLSQEEGEEAKEYSDSGEYEISRDDEASTEAESEGVPSVFNAPKKKSPLLLE